MITKKAGQATDGCKALGAVFIGSSMLTLMLSLEHSMAHRFGTAALGIGSVLMSVGSPMLLPRLFLAAAAFMGALFGYTGVFRFPILVLLALAGVIVARVWWKDKQAKAFAKCQTHRP